MGQTEKRIENLVGRLRESGYRLTPQRMAIINTLIGNKEHLSVDDIYERVRVGFPMIGLATVYKSISMLKEMGEITELNFLNDSARFDGSGETPHPHIICTQCKTVIDINDYLEFRGHPIKNLPTEIRAKTGFEINNFRLDFFGICPACQAEN